MWTLEIMSRIFSYFLIVYEQTMKIDYDTISMLIVGIQIF